MLWARGIRNPAVVGTDLVADFTARTHAFAAERKRGRKGVIAFADVWQTIIVDFAGGRSVDGRIVHGTVATAHSGIVGCGGA